MKRRFFLFAAPAIIAAPSLMRVSAAVLDNLAAVPTSEITLSELISKTLRNRSGLLARQIMENNALLRMLKEQSGVSPILRGIDRISSPWSSEA